MGDTAPDQSGTGSAPPRPKRSETRFCRTPQWLYGTGISLQAIAAYGWLHGKYGYLPRINPSYATLAEELGVSRGSVITYFKELVGVGAVRVTVGGPKGRTINSYEIAFDAPFAFPSGQPADHSEADARSVVSPLTTTSQRADQTDALSGQRAVPDKEAFKNLEDSLSSSASDDPTEPPVAGEREIIADAAKTANRLTAAQKAVRGVVTLDEEPAFIAWVTAKHNVRGPAFWRTAADDMPELADLWRADQTPAAQTRASPGLPPWCTECGDELPEQAQTNARFRTINGQPCKACHPDHCKEPAA